MSELGDRLRNVVGQQAVLDRPEDIMMYEYDGGLQKHGPEAVVFPCSTEEVAGVVRLAADEGLPLLARGAGTGLSGGAIPVSGGKIGRAHV